MYGTFIAFYECKKNKQAFGVLLEMHILLLKFCL